MKTTIERLKLLGQNNATLKDYVARQEAVAPRALPPLTPQDMFFIGYAPMNSPEQWLAQRKEQINTVEAYLVTLHTQQEDALLGSDTRKGVLDFVADFKAAVRGSFLPPIDDADDYYLSKPLDVLGVDFSTEPYGDNYYLIIASVTLECRRIFNV